MAATGINFSDCPSTEGARTDSEQYKARPAKAFYATPTALFAF